MLKSSETAATPPLAKPKRAWPNTRRTTRNVLRQVVLLALFLVAWELASGRIVEPIFVSKPSVIFDVWREWLADGTLTRASWQTLKATLISFAVGGGVGILVGYVLGSWRWLGDLLQPSMTALYTLPKLALAPLFILWFGIDLQFRVAFAAVIVFFLVYYNTYYGVREVPRDLIAAVKLMGANRWQVATKVVAPSALSWVAAGLKISLPMAFVGVIVAEMLASDQGLGFLVARSSNQFYAPGTFVAITAILVLALVIDQIVQSLTARSLRWKTLGAVNEGRGGGG
jgi:NitT/TauT family transport system permease protein